MRLEKRSVVPSLYLSETREWLLGASFRQLAIKYNVSIGTVTPRCYRTLSRLLDHYNLEENPTITSLSKANRRPEYWLNLIDRYEKEGGAPTLKEFRERERKVSDLTVTEFKELIKEIIKR